MFFAKDFIETAEGLRFAIVEHGTEHGKVLCFLRYVQRTGGWEKIATDAANTFLQQHHPDYLHYSPVLDAHLHAVATNRVIKHHQPKQRLQQIMQAHRHDAVEQDLLQLCLLLQEHGLELTQCGITGSLLIGVQKHSSDIDLICYGRTVFQQCRAIIRKLIDSGRLQELNEHDWRQSYQRRSCDLSFAEYVWHERRKVNKAVINGRKFDLSFIDDSPRSTPARHQKHGAVTLRCKIVDDTHAFDYPARFKIAHEQIDAIVSFTATYTGQALAGETVEVSGVVEQTADGRKRIVVGSTREAHGEYIKVVHA